MKHVQHMVTATAVIAVIASAVVGSVTLDDASANPPITFSLTKNGNTIPPENWSLIPYATATDTLVVQSSRDFCWLDSKVFTLNPPCNTDEFTIDTSISGYHTISVEYNCLDDSCSSIKVVTIFSGG